MKHDETVRYGQAALVEVVTVNCSRNGCGDDPVV